MALFGAAALAGHIFPIYLPFKGGKGVATGAGVVFALSWVAGLAALGAWAAAFVATRYVSLASVVAAIALPVAQVVFKPGEAVKLALFVGFAALVLWRHGENLRRIFRGEEPRVRFGTPKP